MEKIFTVFPEEFLDKLFEFPVLHIESLSSRVAGVYDCQGPEEQKLGCCKELYYIGSLPVNGIFGLFDSLPEFFRVERGPGTTADVVDHQGVLKLCGEDCIPIDWNFEEAKN